MNTGEHSRAHEPGERAGLGLLSRFLGAVFLVLVSGLLLLDRALLRANESQAALDAQSAALLVESFLSSRAVLLDRVISVVGGKQSAQDALSTSSTVTTLLQTAPDVRRVWKKDLRGVEVTEGVQTNGALPLPADVQRKLDAIIPTAEPSVVVTSIGAAHMLVSLVRAVRDSTSAQPIIVGMTFDGHALRSWLERVQSGTRVALVVMSGTDTITALGSPEQSRQALTASTRTVRLPSGGTWTITTTHALATRFLRWALWALGILGAVSLAYGLLREQRRAIQASSRSMELERLYSDVKRANQAKSEFLANISHELRTPLNAIVGFVELLREGFYGDLVLRQVPPVDRIAASATHLRHLVDQVLDIAKIAAGRLEVHAELIALRPLVLNVASELESLMNEKKLSFAISVGSSLPRVRTDPAHLRQILINLIGNAVKFTPAGTISVRSRLVNLSSPAADPVKKDENKRDSGGGGQSLEPRTGTWVALQVVDTGVGIAEINLERIFDEFEQVDAGPRGDSMNRGTGLGLPISRRLARLLGGDITVESERGRGSTFSVWLPINSADLIRPQVPAPASDVDATQSI